MRKPAYNTKRHVECYGSTKGRRRFGLSALSTGIPTYQLIPKGDGRRHSCPLDGLWRTSAKDGSVFSNIF